MNMIKNAATAVAVVALSVSLTVINSNHGLPVSADSTAPQQNAAESAGRPGLPIPASRLGTGSTEGTSGGPALPLISAATTVLQDNFNRPNSPTVGANWIEVEQAGAATVSIANNKLAFDNTSDVNNRPLVQRDFATVSTGTIDWDFDFDWDRTGNENIYRLMMQLGNSATMTNSTQNTGVGVNLIWTPIGGQHQSLGNRQGGVDHFLAEVSGSTHVHVTANLGNKTYSVEVDGVTVKTGIPFTNNVALNRVRFMTNNLNEENFSQRTFDNVTIVSSDTPPPVNIPPTAQGQSVSTSEGTPRSVTLTATDPEQCQLVFSIVTPPANGSLGALNNQPCVSGSPNSDSAIVSYTPNGGFNGSDSFTWRANDGQSTNNLSNIATVNISVTGAGDPYNDNFNRPDNSVVGNGWVEVEQAGVPGASVSISNNQLFFDKTSDIDLRPLVKRAFPGISSGTVQIDFDLEWNRIGNEGTYRFMMQFGNSAAMSDASAHAGAGINLGWTVNNGTHEALVTRKSGVDTFRAVVSGPKHISVTANLNTQTYSLAVNGSVVGTNIPFDTNGPLNQVRFLTDKVGQHISGRRIDNLTIVPQSGGNLPPVAQDGSINTPANTPVNLALVYTDSDGPAPYTFTIVSGPGDGTLTPATGANRTYTPNGGFTGTDSFTWRVTDGLGAPSNVATMTVNVVGGNVAPVAENDSYDAFENTTLTVGAPGVLANDSDANGDPLTAVFITPQPTNGNVTLNSNGSFTYTPNPGFSGTDVFTYVAHDGQSPSNVALVTIDVAQNIGSLNLQPVNGQTTVSVKPTLEIDCVVGSTTAAHYQIATNSAFTTVVYDSGANINDICSHLALSAGLNTSTTYWWRARIKDNLGVWSGWSQPTSFTTVNSTPVFNNNFQDGVNGYNGTADADIRGCALVPTQTCREWNQGAQGVIRTGRRLPGQATDEIFRTLLKFDIDGLLTNPNAVVNAYIELTGWHHSDSNHLFHAPNSMYKLNKDWGEGIGLTPQETNGVAIRNGEVSWTYTKYDTTSWGINGAAKTTNPNADRSATPLVHQVSTNQEGSKSYWSSKKLVDAVKGWISDPNSNYGVLIKADDEMTLGSSQQTLHRASREAQHSTQHPCPANSCHPKLVIVSTQAIQGNTNDAPVAQNQSASTGVNQSLPLLLSSTDPDGPTPYNFTIVSGPSNGTLSPSGPGGANRTYTPNAGYTGPDSFTWRVTDGAGAASNVATFSITVSLTTTLLSDNFNRSNNATVGNGWTEVEQVGATVSINNNRVFFDETSDASNRPLLKRSFTTTSSGLVQWKFDVNWTRTGEEGTYRLLMQLGNSAQMSDNSQNNGVGPNLIWTTINGTHQALGFRQGGVDTFLTQLTGQASITVSANLATKTYSVAVNGVVIQSNIAFNSNVSLNQVRFLTDNLNHSNFSGRTIDDVTITAQ